MELFHQWSISLKLMLHEMFAASLCKQALRVANRLARCSLEWTCRTRLLFRSEHCVSLLRHETILVFKSRPWTDRLASPTILGGTGCLATLQRPKAIQRSAKFLENEIKCLAINECNLACQKGSTSYHETCVLLELLFGTADATKPIVCKSMLVCQDL